MHNFVPLLKGEMTRLLKYNIIQVSFAVTALWILILYLIGSSDASTFVPLVLFMDASMMTVLLVGANLFFEKQENTLKTLLITPSSYLALMLAKMVSAIYLAMQSAIIISVVAVLLFEVEIAFLTLFIFIVLIAAVHTAIGFTFTIYTRDFNGLLAGIMVYMITFAVPSILFELDLLGASWEYILMISPTHVSLLLMNHSFMITQPIWFILVGVLYLLGLSFVLFKYIVFPKYAETAVKE
jgi:fluoroquinolone transport system permease protein